ncbi:MAG: sigma factor-like helix-turn-helix DNA-binding protein [Ardenticatenia bacterium]|nr:sigma factor-like helix-turn-helix DNA-binding protein [Ardenticatenia bacterium]
MPSTKGGTAAPSSPTGTEPGRGNRSPQRRTFSPGQRECITGWPAPTGLSHQDIATMLNVPLGTVKSRIRLGMRKLQAPLQGEQSKGRT